jgi:hypothetical protein
VNVTSFEATVLRNVKTYEQGVEFLRKLIEEIGLDDLPLLHEFPITAEDTRRQDLLAEYPTLNDGYIQPGAFARTSWLAEEYVYKVLLGRRRVTSKRRTTETLSAFLVLARSYLAMLDSNDLTANGREAIAFDIGRLVATYEHYVQRAAVASTAHRTVAGESTVEGAIRVLAAALEPYLRSKTNVSAGMTWQHIARNLHEQSYRLLSFEQDKLTIALPDGIAAEWSLGNFNNHFSKIKNRALAAK